MELTKTFLERLQHVQGELRAIASSPELRQLVQSDYYSYDPDLTIIDAIHAVSEVVDAYEQNYCVFHLQAGGELGVDDLGIPFN
ncbi:MAG: hypothetical protein KME54_26755 [Tolypothrix brevis GSE-NOS-MK-07-07A]|jgi:hypothetical protein|nr:hypothetical protein [Tolypothrix brevis GSE-NOS-MK-07-07A]